MAYYKRIYKPIYDQYGICIDYIYKGLEPVSIGMDMGYEYVPITEEIEEGDSEINFPFSHVKEETTHVPKLKWPEPDLVVREPPLVGPSINFY